MKKAKTPICSFVEGRVACEIPEHCHHVYSEVTSGVRRFGAALWCLDAQSPRPQSHVPTGWASICTTASPSYALPRLLASISKAGAVDGDVTAASPVGSPRGLVLEPPSTPERRRLEDAPTPRAMKIRADAQNRRVDSHAIRLTGQALQEHTQMLEKVAAFVGSLVLAVASKAAHHVSSHHLFSRDPEQGVERAKSGKSGASGKSRKNGMSQRRRASFINPSFSDSFSLPWKQHCHERETIRATRELAESIANRGLDYERGLDVRAAVQCFEEAVKLQPDDLVHLCLAAKQWSDLTFFHDVTTERERQVVNRKAIEFAERAIALHPQSPGGYLGVCVAKGRLALFTDNKTKVKLAKEAHEAAHNAVKFGPENDIAWHVTGRWHAEMAKLNVVVRTIVKVMYGTSLESGSKEDALRAYKRAIELAPERLIHYVEAGRVLVELNRKEEARRYLEASLEKEVEDINAWQTRHDAEELLAKLKNSRWERPSNTPPNVPDRRDHTKFSTTALLGDHPLVNDLSDDTDN